MADINVTFYRAGRILTARNVSSNGTVVTVPVIAGTDCARIVSPSALRLWIDREPAKSNETENYTVIAPGAEYWQAARHGDHLHFTGDAFGVVDNKAVQ